MKRILITGHSGMLGSSIVDAFLPEKGIELIGMSRSATGLTGIRELPVDLTDEAMLRKVLREVDPDVIVHTAAYTNLQYCEDNIVNAFQLHVHATRILAEHKSARFIYISTDSIFDGNLGNYAENDPSYPLNYYAHSKLQGEWTSLHANPDSLILRTNIYGFKTPPGNSLAEWALANFRAKKKINGYSDVMFNPLYVGQLSYLILKLIHSQRTGILHVGASENISKFAFLKKLAGEFGYPEDSVSEIVAPHDNLLRRPRNTTLNIGQLKDLLGQEPLITAGLRMFKSDYSKKYEAN